MVGPISTISFWDSKLGYSYCLFFSSFLSSFLLLITFIPKKIPAPESMLPPKTAIDIAPADISDWASQFSVD